MDPVHKTSISGFPHQTGERLFLDFDSLEMGEEQNQLCQFSTTSFQEGKNVDIKRCQLPGDDGNSSN